MYPLDIEFLSDHSEVYPEPWGKSFQKIQQNLLIFF